MKEFLTDEAAEILMALVIAALICPSVDLPFWKLALLLRGCKLGFTYLFGAVVRAGFSTAKMVADALRSAK